MKFKITSDLSQAKNIGATIEKCLNEIDVFTLADLEKMTSVEAFKKIRGNYPDKTVPVCYYLYSLEGALLNLHWNDIPSELKEELKAKIND
ncbi:MAG: TfoX/Sxy family protein [Akkermansia sp.]|uniref:TfoX/Sxy family protein n=1 Tax=Akkermansia sp. TaxID=1872421 RepID=UPI0025BB5B15|nr:TfoX/Sxy family protein [Akkermansia sp.]MBS5508036.1 TfoX/Sxy family protein [Akkermansia sp.]